MGATDSISSPLIALKLLLVFTAAPLLAQDDPGQRLNAILAEQTGKRLQATFEIRQRAEDRTGVLFGRDRDLAADFIRSRFGLTFRPLSWIKISGLAQDTRAPFYGLPAPGNVRDPHDLQEGYVELFSASQKGPGLTVGRQMINYGDTRLIGSPQWAYTARTWDTARAYYVTPRARFEFLHISPMIPRGDGFNKPVLGDRIFGMYNTFKEVGGKATVDAYILRHAQNHPGGFTSPGTLGINLFGSRWAVPLPRSFRFTLEGILQNGHVGTVTHRAGAWVGQFGYKTAIRKRTLDFANEYKFASGTNPNSGRSGTFDQLYPAAHDKFGHVDIIGWRNIHNIRSITTYSARKTWQWILMYNANWLADPHDGLYSAQGRLIARAPRGDAGRYVGQEVDLYSNFQFHGMTISAGIGQFLPGGFIERTTPGASSRLIYLSTSYAF